MSDEVWTHAQARSEIAFTMARLTIIYEHLRLIDEERVCQLVDIANDHLGNAFNLLESSVLNTEGSAKFYAAGEAER